MNFTSAAPGSQSLGARVLRVMGGSMADARRKRMRKPREGIPQTGRKKRQRSRKTDPTLVSSTPSLRGTNSWWGWTFMESLCGPVPVSITLCMALPFETWRWMLRMVRPLDQALSW